MKQLLLFLLFLIPLTLSAQTDSKYLAGAVPMKEGKIVFTKEIKVPNRSKDQIYTTLLQWAQQRFNTKDQRVVFKDAQKGQIAILSKEYIIFSQSALSLDRSMTSYRLVIQAMDNLCQVEMDGIRYSHNVSYQEKPETYIAEEWIIDKVALNGKKTKLSRVSGKFRKGTIDLADRLFTEVSQALGADMLNGQPAVAEKTVQQELQQTPTETADKQNLEGYTAFHPDRLPNTLAALLSESHMTLTTGETSTAYKNAAWKGLGNMFGKPVASIRMDKKDAAYKALEAEGIYKIRFTQPDQQDAWCIMECKKQGETAEGDDVVVMGEVLHLWIK